MTNKSVTMNSFKSIRRSILLASVLGGGATACDSSPEDIPNAAIDDAGAASNPQADGASKNPVMTTDSSSPNVTLDGGVPAGWLYTKGSKIYVSTGTSGTPWMGRGVNIDDVFFCGVNNALQAPTPDKTLESLVAGLMSGWKPNFVRVSLWMNSKGFKSVNWASDTEQYATMMTSAIRAIGANPNVYVLITLRTDATMTGQASGDPDPTGVPSAATDTVYQSLVDTFANDNFVMFGLSNEPGGNNNDQTQIVAAMTHAAGTIRAEEDKLRVPHHLVSVQGTGYTANVSFYDSQPLPYNNLVYEVHGYPPPKSGTTFSNIPVIIGEYGSLKAQDQAAFYADLETRQIPNLAWDFDPLNSCNPDLLQVTGNVTDLKPSDGWGTIVQTYLLAHAAK